jgi:hypothetical protein
MLSDGSINLSKVNKGEGKYAMTMKVNYLNYLNYLQHLNEDIYSQITNKKTKKQKNKIFCLSE